MLALEELELDAEEAEEAEEAELDDEEEDGFGISGWFDQLNLYLDRSLARKVTHALMRTIGTKGAF